MDNDYTFGSARKNLTVVILGILLIAGIVAWETGVFQTEKIDYVLVIDSEVEEEYLGDLILKSQIYDFSYKIINPLDDMVDYLVQNLIFCAEGNTSHVKFNGENYNRLALNDWLKEVDPINLILDLDYANSFRPLISRMNVYASSNLTLKVELLENQYDYKWSFLGSWLKNFNEGDLEQTFEKVVIDGLITRVSSVGSTGVQFWKGSQGTYITFWS